MDKIIGILGAAAAVIGVIVAVITLVDEEPQQLEVEAVGSEDLEINQDGVFMAVVTGGTSPVVFSWNFDDGSKSNQKNPSHAFVSEGLYAVSLKVTDANKNKAEAGIIVEISALSPIISSGSSFPDLSICKVDVTSSKVTVCNIGTASVPAKEFHLAWSQSWYTKQGWNHATLVNYPDPVFIPTNGQKEFILSQEIDVGTEFMVDATNKIKESNENNNCVNTESNIIPCRRS